MHAFLPRKDAIQFHINIIKVIRMRFNEMPNGIFLSIIILTCN